MSSAHDYSFKSIDGGDLPMSVFKDKVVLVVNTASACGLTPQYEGLEKLYSELKDKGFVVLGVPCNQFAGQEPGTEAEIKTFCETRFSIDFPLAGKAEVKGEGAHPFYKWAEQALGEPAVPTWNFHKILVGKNGQAVRAFGPKTPPDDVEMWDAINNELLV
jgi:glutathione peroxidase